MRWFGSMCIYFQHVNVSSRVYLFQFIALLFVFPCFEINNFLFKIVYASQKRQLVRIGRNCGLQSGGNLGIKLGDLSLDDSSIMDTELAPENWTGG